MKEKRYVLPQGTCLNIRSENDGNFCRVTIEKFCGSGASCMVYSGTQQMDFDGCQGQREVIIKQFYPLKLSDWLRWDPEEGLQAEECREDFEREKGYFIRGQANRLLYTNRYSTTALPGLDFFGSALGTVYAVSARGEGTLMSEWKSEEHTVSEALTLAASVCEAIYRLHAGGAVYLDCKPDNIYVDQNCRAYLFDFNTAQRQNNISVSFYTEGWAAPEQMTENRNGCVDVSRIGFHTDAFGIGAVAFFLLTGRCPEEAELRRMKERTPWRKWVRAEDPNDVLKQRKFCEELSRVMGSALEPDPQRRKVDYGRSDGVRKLANEFRELSRQAEIQPDQQPVVRKNGPVLAVSLLTLLLVGALAWAWFKPERTAPIQPDFVSQGVVKLSGVDDESMALQAANGQVIPDLDTEIQVAVGDSGKWGEQLHAAQGDQVSFRVHVKNQSDHPMTTLLCRILLPKSLRYVEGSTRVQNSNAPDGATVDDSLVTNRGLNIGDYAPGAGAWIYFRATVDFQNPQTENMILRTVLQATAGEEVMEDTADVLVDAPGPVFLQMQTSQKESSIWNLSAQVKDWDEFCVRLYFKNMSEEQLDDLELKTDLPARLEYVPGSTVLCCGGTGGREVPVPDGITEQGVGLGSYGPGADGYLVFRVRVKSGASDFTGRDLVTAHLSGRNLGARDSVELSYN